MVRPTSASTLVTAALAGAASTWIAVNALSFLGRSLPAVPLLGVVTLGLVAVAVAFAAIRTHQRLHVQQLPMLGQRGIFLLALAKTSLVAGAFLGAGYLALGLLALPNWDAPAPRERALSAGLAALAAAALAVAGWFLERACQLPGDEDEAGADSPDQAPEPS